MWLIVFVVTFVAILVGAFVLLSLLLLLIPGRKGYMKTMRGFSVPGSVDQAFETVRRRLLQERLELLEGGTPQAFRAARPAAFLEGPEGTKIVTHEGKALEVAGQITPGGGAARVDLTMWTPDFVLLDTGEGAHIDEVLDRIAGVAGQEDRPLATDSHVVVGMATAVLALFAALLPLAWAYPRRIDILAYEAGAGAAAATAWLATDITRRAVQLHPERVGGGPWCPVGYALSALGVAAAIGVSAAHYAGKLP